VERDKSHALINGIIQEYDLCFNNKNSVYKVNEEEFQWIGEGVIVDVCGVPHHEKELKCFYRKIIKNKKRSSW